MTNSKLGKMVIIGDPEEEKNLAAHQTERMKSMKIELENWQASVVRSLNGKDYR